MKRVQDRNNYRDRFSARENSLIDYCITYESGNAAGLPGHGLMLIIGKLVKIILEYKAVNDALTLGDNDNSTTKNTL